MRNLCNFCAFLFFAWSSNALLFSLYLLSLFAAGPCLFVFHSDLSKGSLSCIVHACMHVCVCVVSPVLSLSLCSGWPISCHLSGAPHCYCASRGVCQLQVPNEGWCTAKAGMEESNMSLSSQLGVSLVAKTETLLTPSCRQKLPFIQK